MQKFKRGDKVKVINWESDAWNNRTGTISSSYSDHYNNVSNVIVIITFDDQQGTWRESGAFPVENVCNLSGIDKKKSALIRWLNIK